MRRTVPLIYLIQQILTLQQFPAFVHATFRQLHGTQPLVRLAFRLAGDADRRRYTALCGGSAYVPHDLSLLLLLTAQTAKIKISYNNP
jgi:hypothetical protein